MRPRKICLLVNSPQQHCPLPSPSELILRTSSDSHRKTPVGGAVRNELLSAGTFPLAFDVRTIQRDRHSSGWDNAFAIVVHHW